MEASRDLQLSADVQAERLRLAMDLGGFATYASLESASGLSSDTLRGWSKGRVERPSFQSRLSIESALPVRYEFLTEPTDVPSVTNVNFRSLQAAGDVERNRMKAYMAIAAMVGRTLLGKIDVSARHYLSPAEGSLRNVGVVAAGRLRSHLGLGAEPAPDLVALSESLGIITLYGPQQSREIDACSGWAGTQPLIVLNPAKGEHYRQRWDVAHELGHLVMHSDESPRNNRTKEAQADSFAEGLLFPPFHKASTELRELIESDAPFENLVEMQERWDVSVDALLQIAARTARNSLRDAVTRRRLERLAISDKSAPVGPARAPESPSVISDAVAAIQETAGTPDAVLAYKLGIKPELLATISASRPEDARAL